MSAVLQFMDVYCDITFPLLSNNLTIQQQRIFPRLIAVYFQAKINQRMLANC
jgi:hypothetical protein